MSLWRNPSQQGDPEEFKTEAAGVAAPRPSMPQARPPRGEETEMANIGKSISIKGDVLGEEDTVIEGRVEGRIELKNHHLTIGPNGDVQGEVSAKQITIVGRVSGNVISTERLELRESGRIEGDLITPRLLVQEGAQVNGKISMKPVVGAAKVPDKNISAAPPQAKAS